MKQDKTDPLAPLTLEQWKQSDAQAVPDSNASNRSDLPSAEGLARELRRLASADLVPPEWSGAMFLKGGAAL